MPIETSLSFKGLQTAPNNLGAASEGALVVADNVTIRYPDVLEPRRGQQPQQFGAGLNAGVGQIAFFDGSTVIHQPSISKLRTTQTPLGVPLVGDYYAADPLFRLKSLTASQTFYAATDAGVIALENPDDTTPRPAGIWEPRLPVATVVPDPTSPAPVIPGFLLGKNSVAYRVLFGYKDSHDQLHLGPPSNRITAYYNGAPTDRASVKVDVPLAGIPKAFDGNFISGVFVRLYRSVMTTDQNAVSDELYLAMEVVVDPAIYNEASTLTMSDVVAQEFLVGQVPLYTNATQEGAIGASYPPPYARDVDSWSERTWYANTEQPNQITVQLLGVGGGQNPSIPATGLRVGDTVTVNGVTFTGGTSTVPAALQFQVYTTGTPAENISKSVENLAYVVNEYTDSVGSFRVRAYVEAMPFSDSLFNFQIRFQRTSVASYWNTPFSVVYRPSQFEILSVDDFGGGIYRLYYPVGSIVHNEIAIDDYVQILDQDDATQAIALVTDLDSHYIEVQYAGDVDLGRWNLVQRAYANSVWNPDISVAQTTTNERAPNRVYYSKYQEPEAVPLLNYIDVGVKGQDILRIVAQRDRLLVFKEEGVYVIYGDAPFSTQLLDDTVQLLAPDSAIAIGSLVLALMDDGIVAISEAGIEPISKTIDSTIKPYLASVNRETVARGAFSVAYESEKVFALFMPALSGAYASEYGAKAWVYGLLSGAWTTWTYTQPRVCGKVDPIQDKAWYGLSASPWLMTENTSSTTADYTDNVGMPVISTIRWAASTMGGPPVTKQARELHLHFRDLRSPVGETCTFAFQTDISSTASLTPLTPVYSAQTVIGPSVLPIQQRYLIAQEVQRGAYYNLTLNMVAKNSYWALNGYSIVYEATSERTSK